MKFMGDSNEIASVELRNKPALIAIKFVYLSYPRYFAIIYLLPRTLTFKWSISIAMELERTEKMGVK